MKIYFWRKKSKAKNKKNKFHSRTLFFGLIFFASITLASQYSPAEAVPQSTLYFNPAALSVNGGQNFSVDAVINPGANQVSAVELHVTFDASKFQLNNINNNSSAFPQVLQSAVINNTNGTASIILGVPLSNPPTPVTSETTIATFSFSATGSNGPGAISFANGTRAAAINESSNVIVSQSPSQVTIGYQYGNSDFAVLASDWLQNKESAADIDNDGTINTKDLGIMMSNWGN